MTAAVRAFRTTPLGQDLRRREPVQLAWWGVLEAVAGLFERFPDLTIVHVSTTMDQNDPQTHVNLMLRDGLGTFMLRGPGPVDRQAVPSSVYTSEDVDVLREVLATAQDGLTDLTIDHVHTFSSGLAGQSLTRNGLAHALQALAGDVVAAIEADAQRCRLQAHTPPAASAPSKPPRC